MNRILLLKKMDARMQLLETTLKGGNINFEEAVELMDIYFKFQQVAKVDALAQKVMASKGYTAEMAGNLAQRLANYRRFPLVEQALQMYIKLKPNDPQGWVNLAALQVSLNKGNECLVSLQRAIQLGGETTRSIIRKDTRFNPIRNTPQFQQLIPPIGPPSRLGLLQQAADDRLADGAAPVSASGL